MSIKPSHILGINSRHNYTKLNSSRAKQYGFSKLKAKELLVDNGINTAQVYHAIENSKQLDDINWGSVPVPFVIKPASGSAGKGVFLVTKKVDNKMEWLDFDGQKVTEDDFKLHVYNILDGEYSTWGSNHKAIVEELILPHPAIGKYAYKGTPDIRVVVFNSVPVMAMARIPTKESEGRANLDRGAIGLGIDMATGATTYGIKGKSEYISRFPNSKKKVNGILIPDWDKVLELAVRAANAGGYMFMGADLFISADKGPMVVELNGYPGLSIQLANKAGLKKRLERVEGLNVRDPKHGVKIAKALFGEMFADKIKAEEGLKIISTFPHVDVYGDDKKYHGALAMVNTSRFRSAISENLAEELELVDFEDLLWQQQSLEGNVPVVEVKYKLKDRKIDTAMIVSKKLNKKRHQVEIGRRDLQGFLIGEIEE